MGLKKVSDVNRGTDTPILTITKSNARLNRAGVDEYYDGEDYVELFYDDDRNLVGFDFIDDKEKKNGNVQNEGDDSNVVFPVGKPLNGLGIIGSRLEDNWKFEVELVQNFGIPVVDITELIEWYENNINDE